MFPTVKVTLEAVIQEPYNLAVATARTCYSPQGIVRVSDVARDAKAIALRDKIAKTTRDAGHLTTRQHGQFVFSLEGVSRHLVWSFLHSHPYYNSEQTSQRYVRVSKNHYTVPPMNDAQRDVYCSVVLRQMQDYEALIGLLLPLVEAEYFRLFPIRLRYPERYGPLLQKKAYEIARYVLPIATHASLYHSISPLTLMRYHRMMYYYDAPCEQGEVIKKMLECVKSVDPDFVRELATPYREEEFPETALVKTLSSRRHETETYLREFDASLNGRSAVLCDYKARAPQSVAAAVRSVLGLAQNELSDAEALEKVLNPAQNIHLADTLNVNTLSKLTRSLLHAHYTFRKKLSHSADSQDQRHRMTPASRPLLEAHYSGRPDYIVPRLVESSEAALAFYARSMQNTFEGIERLLDMGLKSEFALYLLPNAFPIRFEESGDLLNLHHKWHTRSCYTAQEEIFYATLDEIKAVQDVHPQLVRHMLAPCYIRNQAGVKPICPEGERFCGVKVWEKKIEAYQRLI